MRSIVMLMVLAVGVAVARAGVCEQAQTSPPRLRIAKVIEVTDGTTRYMQPVWSPDGKKLAFTRDGFTGLYVRNADGTGPIKELTSADYSGYEPVWTSDSKAIILRTRKSIVSQSITLIDVETGEVKVIAEKVFHPRQPERNTRGDVVIEIAGERKVLDPATGKLRTMEEYYSEEIPQDEVRIEMDFRNKRLWIIQGDKRTQFPHKCYLARLSPTKDRIVFYQGSNTYVSDLQGGSLVNLGIFDRPMWSEDGKRLVGIGAIQENEYTMTASEIFICNADGSGLTQLTFTPDIVEDEPRWSPDGMKIAYSGWNTGKIYVAILEEVR